ncbi:hypothetical protein BDQ94DRAFT_176195 [Aspergillus welwitschiae]|uniref:Uncharacterized protein n=1 Tax=Aspergillus welwitschiae TaxID=1341132 RepID=A0A3F3PIM2_9EURO|nr:hypothetical protein BDQ94DRAFT_176195 [Aspergillus welwitschiae]RDH26717.1 hypothetical protein BDQ94DRAFT_176195 [Aspergillus welwitschiae]
MAQCLPVEEEGNGQDRTGPTESPFLLLRNGRLRKVGSWSPHRNPDACPATFIEPGGNTTQHQHASELTDERDLSLTAPVRSEEAIQPSTRIAGQEWQTAHKRRRTVARRALAESSANTRRVKVTTNRQSTSP